MGKEWHVAFNKDHYKNICGDDLADIPAGFCTNKTHIGYLSIQNVKHHECDKKKCQYLIKNLKNQYWTFLNRKKIIRKYFQQLEDDYLEKRISKEHYYIMKKVQRIDIMLNYLKLDNNKKKIEGNK